MTKMTTSSEVKLDYALVDADVMVYRVGFTTEEEPLQIAKARLTEWLEDFLFINLKVDDYQAYLTGKGNFREEVAVTVPYKGNRVDLKRPIHYEALREHLVKRHGAVITDGEEADDAVAIQSVERLDKCWIVHVDKDLDQLQGWHYNPVKDERYYVSEFEGLRNFYKQILTGDRIDNIQGLHGIGPKKAEKALQDCKTEQELYEAVCEMYNKHEQELSRVIENGQLLWLRRKQNQLWCPPSTSQDVSGKST